MALRTIRKHNHDLILTVAVAVTALILFSCQKEDLNLKDNGKVTIYPVIGRAIETTVQTRAIGDTLRNTAFTELTDSNRQTLSVNAIAFKFEDGTWKRKDSLDEQGIFVPLSTGNGDSWRSTVEVTNDYRYSLYTYSRTMPAPNGYEFSYGSESDVSLKFSGLYLLSTTDPLVCVAAAGKLLPDNPQADQRPPLLEKKFDIGVVSGVGQQGSSTKAYLAMNHLYAKATLSFRIDNTYNQLREVRIKNIKIKVNKGTVTGNHVFKFYTQELKLANNKTISGDPDSVNLFNGPTHLLEPATGKDYIPLSLSDREFGYYYFLPMDPTPAMYLEVTYDIYDRVQGNPVRENQTARNYSLFDAISDNGGKATAGKNYKVKVLVSPTYLYQLSDDDLELGLTIE